MGFAFYCFTFIVLRRSECVRVNKEVVTLWALSISMEQIKVSVFANLFSSFMRAHAQTWNEYRGGEMLTEVVIDEICGRKLWTADEVKVSLPFFLFFLNLKLPIMLFSYFVIQFNSF